MSYKTELKAEFDRQGFDYKISYFGQKHFTVHHQKYLLMIARKEDVFTIDTWVEMERIFNRNFTFEQVKAFQNWINSNEYTEDIDINELSFYMSEDDVLKKMVYKYIKGVK